MSVPVPPVPPVPPIQWGDISFLPADVTSNDALLGRGSFGQVVRAQWGRKAVAVKVVIQANDRSAYQSSCDAFLKEAEQVIAIRGKVMDTDGLILLCVVDLHPSCRQSLALLREKRLRALS